jgi:glutaminyl-tRNA synthetase
LRGCKLEPSVMENPEDTRYQFERMGYFVRDKQHESDQPVFNRIESLRDSWSKLEQPSQ